MSKTPSRLPKICLNMIVRNEAHIVHEALNSLAPYIAYWVIVDTGSDDGTQDAIREHMSSLGIPGEMHERPWRDFGRNRSEALTLAQGRGEYIWVFDADDLLVGVPDFSNLSADAYEVRYGEGAGFNYWRKQIFRDGLPFRYEGVVHEYFVCDAPYTEARLDGDYYIDSRRLGGRNLDPQKYARDRDLLLKELEREPDNARTVFYLAQSYYDLGDFDNARVYYAQRAAMDGWDEETYFARYRLAESMSMLEEPWPDVQAAYLDAWEYRPTRAEPLHAIARHCRTQERYQLGYLFAERAAALPTTDDSLFVSADVYAWRAHDEQAVCASWIGKDREAMDLCRALLARPDIPDDARARIAGNRDLVTAAMTEVAVQYSAPLAQSVFTGGTDADVTVTLLAGSDRAETERTLNSFLYCCLDMHRIDRFVVFDAGMTEDDRKTLSARYPFLSILPSSLPKSLEAQLTTIRAHVNTRRWLHLGSGWVFFAPERIIGRLAAVLEAEPSVIQVAINIDDAVGLTSHCPPESKVRRTTAGGRYVSSTVIAAGPAMYDTDRLDHYQVPVGGLNRQSGTTHTITESGPLTATLDEVLCVAEAPSGTDRALESP